MLVTCEGKLPAPLKPAKVVVEHDFSLGQTWWIGVPVSCPYCGLRGFLDPTDTVHVYTRRYKDGRPDEGSGTIRCATCGLFIAFERVLTDEDKADAMEAVAHYKHYKHSEAPEVTDAADDADGVPN